MKKQVFFSIYRNRIKVRLIYIGSYPISAYANVSSLGTEVFDVFYYLASPLGYTRLRRVPFESFIMSVCYIFSIAQNALSLSRK